MTDLESLFAQAAAEAARFRSHLPERPVGVSADLDRVRAGLGGALNEEPADPAEVLAELIAGAEPGLVATAGPRYFGFVIGGSTSAAVAADIMTSAWDQNGFNVATSPAAAVAEEAAGGWLKELFGIPAGAAVGFVTGSQEANTVGLAAGRHSVLSRAGWDVQRRGLRESPRVRVVAGVERHATIDRSLRLLGLGDGEIDAVAADANGAMDMADLERVLATMSGEPIVVAVQSGNVNTGACDNLRAAAELTHAAGGWLHVDGAFGLWAAATPRLAHLVDGIELADSWGCDGHKWLNLPYDSAFVFCADPEATATAVSYTASYLTETRGAVPVPSDYILGSSRRARGFAAWAGMRQLGSRGIGDIIDRCCRLAERFGESLGAAGFDIANDVMLNQVLVGFGDDDRTDRVIAAVQADGACWMGGTTWHGRRLMRIAVSNWTTTEDDVDRSVAAIVRLASSV
ncbi:MAG TPA: pyridoxal-dependent decarboxylase [Nocardioidaceae bacterium]|nr:pyridoxal-dependent decarboxylase [Nocardioidaceae bacterium]